MDKRQDNQAPHQLKKQAAQRDTTCGSISGAIVEHRQQAGTKVSANNQAERHRERDNARSSQSRSQQYRGKAGVADNGEHRANQRIQQNIAGQRGKDHLNTVRLGDRRYGLHNQLQCQQNQPKANTDAAQLPGARLLASEEKNYADKNK